MSERLQASVYMWEMVKILVKISMNSENNVTKYSSSRNNEKQTVWLNIKSNVYIYCHAPISEIKGAELQMEIKILKY